MKEFYNYKSGKVRLLPSLENASQYYFFDKDKSDHITKHGSCLVREAINNLRLFKRCSDRKDRINRMNLK